ncbi:MAG: hypothetical protein ACI4WY_13110 [Anaerovoracaceae bacterium]
MKPVRIAVLMKEPAFGRAVARGLAESGNGFVIEVAEHALQEVPGADQMEEGMDRSPAWEVLVTDCGPESCPDDNPGLVLVDPETCRISQLCRAVQEAADRVRESGGIRSGDCMRRLRETLGDGRKNEDGRQTEVIGLLGFCSGCGVTALAVTAGRMLAGAYGEKVLYLPMTEIVDGWTYRDADLFREGGLQRGKELLYRLSHQLPCSVESFTLRDCYGLEMPEGMDCLPVEERQELLTHLREKGGYDWILVDLGSRKCLRYAWKQTAGMCSALVEVGNRMDSRCSLDLPIAPDGLPKRRILVWNHSAENRMDAGENQWLEIAHDEESFLPDPEAGRIEIAMTKNFAIGVKNLTEVFMNFC